MIYPMPLLGEHNSNALTVASAAFSAIAVVMILASVIATSAVAQDREIRITVYNNNLGLVGDHREIEVPRGQGQIEIHDVPALIDPTSVSLKPTRGKLEVLEQNFQFDLAGPDRILERYLDQPIEVVLKEGALRSGELLSFDGGSLVLRGSDGNINVVNRSEVVDLRFPKLPEGLRTRPTLVWLTQSESAGRVPVNLSYITEGLNWHAEYVAVSNEQDTSMELSAWVSLSNTSGASYPNARLQLIAGEVKRIEPSPPPRPMARNVEMMDAMASKSQGFEEESFFEYHLYTLDRRTSIADRETKQVSLFPTATAPVSRIYEYNGQRDQRNPRVILETENREDLGLGMPLPGGEVRVYKKDSRGDLQFIGEDLVVHTPRNEKIRMGVGKAFDIVGERNELSMNRVSDRVVERTIQVKIRNRKTERIEVVVQEYLWGDWSIIRSTFPGTKKNASTAEFRLEVPADSEAVLEFTVRQQ